MRLKFLNSRKNTRISFCLLLAVGIALIVNNFFKNIQNNEYSHSAVYLDYNSSGNNELKLIINTTGCTINGFSEYHPEALKLWRKEETIHCSNDKHLNNISFLQDGVLSLTNDGAKLIKSIYGKCHFRSIKRQAEFDNDVDYGKWFEFAYKTRVFDEFIQVRCQITVFLIFPKIVYENFHAQIVRKESRSKVISRKFKYNVLLVGIDSTSFNSLKRNLPKTLKYLQNEANAISMEGFVKVAGYTLGNLGVMWRGEFTKSWFDEKLDLSTLRWAWDDFKENHYRTIFAEDCVRLSMYRHIKGFRKQPMEYWMLPFSTAAESKSKELCYGKKSTVSAVLDWTLQFFETYKDEPKLAQTHHTENVHNSFSGLSSYEDEYLNFFKSIYKNFGHNTFIFFYGDHGLRYGPFRATYVGRKEEHLPFFVLVPPKQFIQTYPNYFTNMKTNSKRLTTFFDIYKTLYNILYLDDTEKFDSFDQHKNGTSLFHEISQERNCDTAPLPVRDCLCKIKTHLNPSDNLVQRAAEFIVSELNVLIERLDESHQCDKLKLSVVFGASKSSRPVKLKGSTSIDDKKDSSYIELDINLGILPVRKKSKQGILEATVGFSEDTEVFTLLEQVNRIDAYKDLSSCINKRVLKNICYCL